MKKFITMFGLLLAFAAASFGQSLIVNPKPASGSAQTGTYSTYDIDAGGSINVVPIGMKLNGTYSKITITMTTPVPSGQTDGVIFGIQDQTTSAIMDCSLAVGETTCSYTNSTSFGLGDNITFIIYIPGTGHSGYTVTNLTWRLE